MKTTRKYTISKNMMLVTPHERKIIIYRRACLKAHARNEQRVMLLLKRLLPSELVAINQAIAKKIAEENSI